MQWPNRISELMIAGIRGVYFILLVVLVIFVVSHLELFAGLLQRTENIEVAGFRMQLQTVELPTQGGGIENARWATHHRISGQVSILGVDFSKPEYLEIQANEDVDLTGGYLGDTDELVWLAESRGVLMKGECVRIFTYTDGKSLEDLPKGDRCGRAVMAVRVDGSPTESGIYTRDIGKGDRIVVFDQNRKPILDMDFWWLSD